MDSRMLGAFEVYCKVIQCADDIWDSENLTFLSWEEEKVKFNLYPLEAGDWTILTTKIINWNWRHLLEDNHALTLANQWIGLYRDGAANLTFVL